MRLPPHIPKQFYCLNYHLKNIVDNAIRKTGMLQYNPQKAMGFTENLSIEIGLSLKTRKDRFRTVVLVTIVQKCDQSAVCKMGFLWDATQDHWNHYAYDCRSYTLTACVLCVYVD